MFLHSISVHIIVALIRLHNQTKVTLQPLERFDLDAAIIFSDILVVPQALGMVVEMHPGQGPVFPAPLVTPADLDKLKATVDVHVELQYVFDAITLTRHRLQGRVPLFGFCGAPWTIMAYMIEGGGSKVLSKAKQWLYRYPAESKALLQKITSVSIDYLVAQVQAGAQLLQVFDSWAGELSPAVFAEFALPYLRELAQQVKQRLGPEAAVPMVVFAKGAHYALADLASSDYDVIQLDWTMDPLWARTQVGPTKALQGNMDPAMLYADQAKIRSEVHSMLERFGSNQRYQMRSCECGRYSRPR